MRHAFLVVSSVLLSSCATTNIVETQQTVSPSYLAKPSNISGEHSVLTPLKPANNLEPTTKTGFSALSSPRGSSTVGLQVEALSQRFSATQLVALASDDLPINQLIHQVFGEILKVSYLLDDKAKADKSGVTLNIRHQLSERQLFELTQELLSERGYQVRFSDNIYYIAQQAGVSNLEFGFGREVSDVPRSSLEIAQMVPLQFPIQTGITTTLAQLFQVSVVPDREQNTLTLRGRREQILRALELIHLLDGPSLSKQHIAMYRSRYVSAAELSAQLQGIMNHEGVAVALEKPQAEALSIMSVERLSSLILFAKQPALLKRAKYWLEQLDQASQVTERQYFTYHPRFARANDIAESLAPLIDGAVSNAPVNNSSATSAQTVGKPNKAKSVARNETLTLVVDSRTNALIVYSTGEEYQRLIPLIERMDVMPKQVMLEVIIAEVTLSDEFAQGIEFAFSRGDANLSTLGSFGVEKMGGLSFGIKGVDGQLIANFFETNSHVNILSRPSVVVRDGVQANMNVGTDIPVVGETSSDPDGERRTTSIQYRKTGVQLSVTPTVNSQGVVIMEIQQTSSNQAKGSSTVADSPAIFERAIKTEVVAESGQAVILGGLISENISQSQTKVPFLGDIPWLGALFRSQGQEKTKTELVVMVTPRVIESSNEWQALKFQLNKQLDSLVLPVAP